MEKTIKEMLNAGVVKFTFYKKDGSVREARGTRLSDPAVVGPEYVAPKGNGSAQGVTTYWDLDKNAWRCFNTDSFIEVLEYTEA
jgi:hypothetical protein